VCVRARARVSGLYTRRIIRFKKCIRRGGGVRRPHRPPRTQPRQPFAAPFTVAAAAAAVVSPFSPRARCRRRRRPWSTVATVHDPRGGRGVSGTRARTSPISMAVFFYATHVFDNDVFLWF